TLRPGEWSGCASAGTYAVSVPELPEAERARLRLESVLGRRIAAVDDTDAYVCRPHQAGEIAAALAGHRFVSAHRRGKFLWLETDDGPTLGLHLGMAGSRSRRPRTGASGTASRSSSTTAA